VIIGIFGIGINGMVAGMQIGIDYIIGILINHMNLEIYQFNKKILLE